MKHQLQNEAEKGVSRWGLSIDKSPHLSCVRLFTQSTGVPAIVLFFRQIIVGMRVLRIPWHMSRAQKRNVSVLSIIPSLHPSASLHIQRFIVRKEKCECSR